MPGEEEQVLNHGKPSRECSKKRRKRRRSVVQGTGRGEGLGNMSTTGGDLKK